MKEQSTAYLGLIIFLLENTTQLEQQEIGSYAKHLCALWDSVKGL